MSKDMNRKPKRHLRTGLKVLLVLAVLIGCTVISFNTYVDARLNRMRHSEAFAASEMMISDKAAKLPSHVINIALFGADHDAETDAASTERADAIKILSFNTLTRSVKIISVQRDTLVWIPDPVNDYSKWNHSYWWGGPKLSLQTLNMNLDLNITQYVTFSFEALEHLVDLVGGVDIYLTEAEISDMVWRRGTSLDYKGEGEYHLNGEQALSYCRIRYTDSDYVRMERQNNVMKAVMSSVRKMNPLDIPGVVSGIMPYIETNMKNSTMRQCAVMLLMSNYSRLPSFQVPEGGYESVAASISYGGYSPLYILNSYSDMITSLHAFIYGDDNYEPSSQAQEIERNIYTYFGLW